MKQSIQNDSPLQIDSPFLQFPSNTYTWRASYGSFYAKIMLVKLPSAFYERIYGVRSTIGRVPSGDLGSRQERIVRHWLNRLQQMARKELEQMGWRLIPSDSPMGEPIWMSPHSP